MRVAVVGSRGIQIEDLGAYLPEETSMIISGGAKGVDSCAKQYAGSHKIQFLEFLPEYERYGRAAPLKRNDRILENADYAVIFWDGKSRGTKYVIEQCVKRNIAFELHLFGRNEESGNRHP